MHAHHFDASGKELEAHQVRGGVAGFCSWRRLQEVLRQAGELRPEERLMSYQVDDRGISFRVTQE